MIIGVDESGDFRSGSRGLFVGVFIRPRDRAEVTETFRSWERRARKSLGLQNELKGHAITDPWAHSLIQNVLAPRRRHPIRYLAFAVDVSNGNRSAMDVQRELFIESYTQWAEDSRRRGNSRAASSIERHTEWVRARPYSHLLRLVTLGTIVMTLLEWALPQAILGGFDDELEHMQVLIDHGYVTRDDLPRWRELLRNAIINESRIHPLPILDTWPSDHPFLRRFVDSGSNGATLLKPAFREVIDFHDSVATPEVRIADILAGLVCRKTIAGDNLHSYSSLRRLSLDAGSPYRLIVWTKNRRPAIENPYLRVGDDARDPGDG